MPEAMEKKSKLAGAFVDKVQVGMMYILQRITPWSFVNFPTEELIALMNNEKDIRHKGLS
jgi:hypothetical protein